MSRKTKRSLEFKLAIVKQVLDRNRDRSVKRIAEDNYIDHRLFHIVVPLKS